MFGHKRTHRMANDWARIVATVLAVDAVVVVLGVVLVAREAARRRGSWWAVFDRSRCRGCGEPSPIYRWPQGVSQAVLGGWTCQSCGLECDRWGEARRTLLRQVGRPSRRGSGKTRGNPGF